jgi:hypothetical protein
MISISHNFILLYQIIIFPGQGSYVHIARYVHVALCGLSDFDSGGCLIINYNVPAILLYKYINSYRYIFLRACYNSHDYAIVYLF